jgi:hypothetical protein
MRGAKPAPRTLQPGARTDFWATLLLGAAISAVIALLAFRITLGIDLSDEAYYTAFVDGWLKTGIGLNHALGVHQTAALLVYPFAKVYVFLRGDFDGLALFLRALYIAGSLAAGLLFYSFARELRGRATATLAGLLIPCFIPFSLPSPSYNTIGMLSMVSALSAAAVYFIGCAKKPAARKNAWIWLWGSAFAWTVTVVAYPTLLAVLFIFLIALLLAPPRGERGEVWRYVLACAIFQAIGAGLLFGVFGLDRLLAMLRFSNASLQVSSGIGAKVLHLAGPLVKNPAFGTLFVLSLILGVLAGWARQFVVGSALLVLALAGILLASNAYGPVLFAQSHDEVTLLGAFGAAYFLAPWRGSDSPHPDAALLRVLFAAGLGAGLVTSLTATNGLINFAVGGYFLCLLAVTFSLPGRDSRGRWVHGSFLLFLAGLLLWNAFAYIYGEPRNPLRAEPTRITRGVFAGLITNRGQADAMARTTQLLASAGMPAGSIAVFGRLPGIYLLTTMKPLTLSTWDFGQHNDPTPEIEKIRSAFFADPDHRPDVALIVMDPWTKPPSPASAALLRGYTLCRKERFEPWTVELRIRPGISTAMRCAPVAP